MQSFPLAKAKAELSHLVDLAMNGEEIVITKHGLPVARIVAEHAEATAADVFAPVWALGGLDIEAPQELPADADAVNFDA